MDALTSIFCCLCDSGDPTSHADAFYTHQQFLDDKQSRQNPLPSSSPRMRSPEAIVAEVISILRSAEKGGSDLAQQVDVGTEGWTEWIAEKILAGIETIIKEGKEKMGPAMVEAYDRAYGAADNLFRFAHDHPVATAGLLTIVAVGLLVILAPTIVEALGFAELGPVEGMRLA
ncbi:hypothetical protein DL769_002220 [Monosporascus sp. CRB-8-3]|nr:hypothetical protein DL769_002220 [Monosporascus sp. CRB-8-3]